MELNVGQKARIINDSMALVEIHNIHLVTALAMAGEMVTILDKKIHKDGYMKYDIELPNEGRLNELSIHAFDAPASTDLVESLDKEDLIKIIANMHDTIQDWGNGYGISDAESNVLIKVGQSCTAYCIKKNDLSMDISHIKV